VVVWNALPWINVAQLHVEVASENTVLCISLSLFLSLAAHATTLETRLEDEDDDALLPLTGCAPYGWCCRNGTVVVGVDEPSYSRGNSWFRWDNGWCNGCCCGVGGKVPAAAAARPS
jgi:hypothetical protein